MASGHHLHGRRWHSASDQRHGSKLANAGYLVLLPDLFYRYGPYGPFVPKEVFAGDFRLVLGPLMATTDSLKAATDTRALLAYFDTRDDVAGTKVGAFGFCMGGGMAIAAAGTWPDRFAAVASFHGGRLATDQPTSPHLLAPRIEAELYVAAAENDASCPPDMAERFEAALTDAGVSASSKRLRRQCRASATWGGAVYGCRDVQVHGRWPGANGRRTLLELFDYAHECAMVSVPQERCGNCRAYTFCDYKLPDQQGGHDREVAKMDRRQVRSVRGGGKPFELCKTSYDLLSAARSRRRLDRIDASRR